MGASLGGGDGGLMGKLTGSQFDAFGGVTQERGQGAAGLLAWGFGVGLDSVWVLHVDRSNTNCLILTS